MSAPKVWNEWIGPSSARTLIAMECRASNCLHGVVPLYPSTMYRSTWPSESQQHLFVHRLDGLPSAVVWLAGRAFLIGAPLGVVENLRATGIAPSQRPSEVVLLNWMPEHISGLAAYAEEYSAHCGHRRPLRVWTSKWVWEHVVEGSSLGSNLAANHDPFETERVWRFSPRVSLTLTYGVGDKWPQMFAHLRFMDTHLVIGVGPARIPPLGLPSIEDYATVLSRIYEWFPGRAVLLDDVVQRRLKQLTDASILLASSCTRGSRWYRYSLDAGVLLRYARPGCQQWAVGEDDRRAANCHPGDAVGDCSAFVEEVSSEILVDVPHARDGFPGCAEWNLTKSSSLSGGLALPAPIAAPDEARRAENPASASVSLIIGCGAPYTVWHGKLVPNRSLVLGDRYVSVLEAKILQYAALRRAHNPLFSDTVYVLVSPATEAVVREEVARLWRECSDLEGATCRILRNRVIPRYAEGGSAYFRQEDGGFQYNPAGHFELLWCLAQDPDLHGFFYYTNLTNVGVNVTQDVDQLRQHLTETGSNAVFELTRVEGEHGYGPGSYWIRANGRNALIKPVYFGKEGEVIKGWEEERDTVAHPGKEALMNTGSVMLDADAIRYAWTGLAEVPFFARRQRPIPTASAAADSKEWTIQFERDLDQITWVEGIRCGGIIVAANNGKWRFFAVKGEADLYQRSYEELSRLYDGLPLFNRQSRREVPEPPKHFPFALDGPAQHDPWGNHLLRFLKGLPEAEAPDSEFWESSAYPKGMSRVQRNTLESLPLSDLIPDLRVQMDVMGKILDCHGNLSIQIHPSDRVCAALKARHALEDEGGKEENFYVMRVNDPGIFYLGLNTAKVFKDFGAHGANQKGDAALEVILAEQAQSIDEFGAALLSGLTERFSDHLKKALQDGVPVTENLSGAHVLKLRKEAGIPESDQTLAGIVWIFALATVRQALAEGKATRASGDTEKLLEYLNRIKGLQKGQIVQVRPGMIHAAGPGCCLVEASNQSDNTFRVYDFGREYERTARPMHYVGAAVALSDDSFLDGEKQKRLVYFPGRPGSAGTVGLKVFPNVSSTHQQCLKCESKAAHGHTIICTEGELKLSVTSDSGASEIVLRSAHSAYVRAGATDITISAVEHHISSCAVICSKSEKPKRLLALAVGATHVHFVHWAYPDAPQERKFLWYDKLMPDRDFSWPTRLKVFREELQSFLAEVMGGTENGEIHLGAVSWPGVVIGGEEIDAIHPGDVKLQARRLGQADTSLVKLASNISGLGYSRVSVLFDAEADIAAELTEVGGRLQEDSGAFRPGILLNFASGVCMAISDGSDKQPITLCCADRNGKPVQVGPIGRMLWFDPLTREWSLQPTAGELETPEAPELSPRAIRLSGLLSTTAVVLRFIASESGARFLAETPQKLWTPYLSACRGAELTLSQEARGKALQDLVHEYLADLNAAAPDVFRWISAESDAQDFITEIGRDYGDMLAALLTEFPSLRDKKTIVLGGFGGAAFGRAGSDPFMKIVNEELEFHAAAWGGPNISVVRAQASMSPHRLLHATDWLKLVRER